MDGFQPYGKYVTSELQVNLFYFSFLLSASLGNLFIWNCSGHTEHKPQLLKYNCQIECRFVFESILCGSQISHYKIGYERKHLTESLLSIKQHLSFTQIYFDLYILPPLISYVQLRHVSYIEQGETYITSNSFWVIEPDQYLWIPKSGVEWICEGKRNEHSSDAFETNISPGAQLPQDGNSTSCCSLKTKTGRHQNGNMII